MHRELVESTQGELSVAVPEGEKEEGQGRQDSQSSQNSQNSATRPPLIPNRKSPFSGESYAALVSRRALRTEATAELATCPEEAVTNGHDFQGLAVLWGSATIQGTRRTMEDAMLGVQYLLTSDGKPAGSLFAVFDGHNGAEAAQYARDNLAALVVGDQDFPSQPGQALNSAFVELDEGFYALMKDEPHHLISGSTVLAAMIIAGDLWVANAGDSRAVLSTKSKPEQLSEDHKPNTETERLRIEACGGYVCGEDMLCGEIGVSRSIGDYDNYKLKHRIDKQFEGPLTAVPTISVRTLKAEDEFIVLATDGLWDLYTNERIIELARISLQNNDNDPAACAAHLVSKAEEQHASDNVTVIVVCLSATAPAKKDASIKRAVSQEGLNSLNSALSAL